MKKKFILAALLMSMAVTVFAEEEVVWEEQTAVEDAALAENVFEEDDLSVEEQIADKDPEYVFEEPETIEEETTDEESVFEEIALDEAAEVVQEGSVFEEDSISEELVTEEVSAVDGSPAEQSSAVEGLVYNGEPQELIKYQDGSWTYSLDRETYSSDLPTAVNAGEYTVYMKEGDGEPVVIAVNIAKADVTFTPPVPNTTEELSNTQLE